MNVEAASSFQPPHSFRRSRPGQIPMQRRPEQSIPAVKPSFNLYNKLFEIMEVIERGSNEFDYLPYIEEHQAIPGSERVSALLNYNQILVNNFIKDIGGIPVKFASQTGEALHGTVTESHDVTAGRWELSFQPNTSGDNPRIYHTTEELREGYWATILENTIDAVVTDDQQKA